MFHDVFNLEMREQNIRLLFGRSKRNVCNYWTKIERFWMKTHSFIPIVYK